MMRFTLQLIGSAGIAMLAFLGATKSARAFDHRTLDSVSLACGESATVASVPQCGGGPARVRGGCGRNQNAIEVAATEAREIACLGPAKRPPSVGGVTLNEFQPWLTTRHQLGAAKGVVYFMRGYSPRYRTDDDYHPLHFFLATLSQQGWNIIGAQVPYGVRYTQADHLRLGAYIAERSRQLRKEGYKRIVVGGHSWGSWDTLVAEAQGKLDADALLLVVPATYGERIRDNGTLNPNFLRNRTEFIPLIRAVRKPSALFLFADDAFDPGGRDAIAGEQFKRNSVINLVISKPPAFKGHFASILPVFDFMYGGCIERFIAAPETTACEPLALEPNDFRAVVRLDQIDEAKAATVPVDDAFTGRSFLVYNLSGRIREVTFTSSKAARIRTSRAKSQINWTVEDGQLCLPKNCETIRRWDQRRYLAFDTKSGTISSWWIEK